MTSAITQGTGHKLGQNARVKVLFSDEINIDNGSGTTADYLLGVFDRKLTLIGVRRIYTEATDTAGAASATTSIGTTAGGTQIAAALACSVSKAVGGYDDFTLVNRKVPANTGIFVRHTGVATTEGGKYKIQALFTFDD